MPFALALAGLSGQQATANWTTAPEDWERLRRQWEYGHAVNAALTFLALGTTTAAALLDRP